MGEGFPTRMPRYLDDTYNRVGTALMTSMRLSCLSLGANLYRWGKRASAACSLCTSAREDEVHVLGECPAFAPQRAELEDTLTEDGLVAMSAAVRRGGFCLAECVLSTSLAVTAPMIGGAQDPRRAVWDRRRKNFLLVLWRIRQSLLPAEPENDFADL